MMYRRVVGILALFASAAWLAPARATDPNPDAAVRVTRTYFPKFFLSFSPDGSHFVYSRHYDHRRQEKKILMGMRITKVDGTDDRPFLPDFESSVQIQEHPAWTRDARMMLLTGGGNDTGNASKDIFVCDIDADFKASHLRKIVPGDGSQVGEQASWAPDGKNFVVTTTSHTLWIFDADGKGKRRLLQTAGQYCYQPAWSPDGEWIAFSCDRDGNCEIYKVRADGTELTRLTSEPGVDCRPVWSPDAQWIVFTSNRGGNEDLYLMAPDGSGVRKLTQSYAVDDHAAWSPDGRSIAFISMRDGGFDIYRLPIPGDITVAVAPPPSVKRLEEPAGDLIAHYDFDNATEPIVRDRMTRNSMELFGAKLAGPMSHQTLRFNGSNSYATCGNTRVLQVSGPLTFSVWIAPRGIKGNAYVLSKHGWNLYLGGDYRPRFETRNAPNTAWDTLTGPTPIPKGKWSMVTGVFDPASKYLALYVNGKLSVRRERTDGKLGATESYPLELGCYNAARSQWFEGELDEVRIYKRALTADEVAAEFASQSAKVLAAE